MRVGSLFSGLGGLDLGLERAGMQVAWQAETDPFCSRVLAKHWPAVPNLGDVTEIDWEETERVDLICGGPPCQPISVAGRRRGADDERWLWPEFARCLRHLRPGLALVESVPGLLAGAGMGEILGDLASLGYMCEWESLPAAAFGAPHLRYRVFIVAYRTTAYAVGDQLRDQPEPEPRRGGPAVAPDHGEPGALANSNGSPGRSEGHAVRRNGAAPDGRRGPEEPGGRSSAMAYAYGERLEERRLPAEGWAHLPDPAGGGGSGEGTHPNGSGLAVGSCFGGDARAQLQTSLRSDWWSAECRLGVHPDGLSGRLGCGGWECGVPRIAQGQPGRTDRLRALGNAVVPQVAEWIGRRIMRGEP